MLPSQKNTSSFKASIKDQSGAGKLKIGEMLRKQGYITANQLDEAVKLQKQNGGRLSRILVRLGFIEENTIVNYLSRHHNFPAIDISHQPPSAEALKAMPYELAKRYCAFPLHITGNILHITMAEPTDTEVVEILQLETKHSISLGISKENAIFTAYRKYYQISENEYKGLIEEKKKDINQDDEFYSFTNIDDFGTLASEAALHLEVEEINKEDVSREPFSSSDAPIIKLVNGILLKAINEGVSDIHIEPYEHNISIRYRLDGVLYKAMNLPTSIKNALTSRLKILSHLNITERRKPQDGRFRLRVGPNRTVDLRVSSLPTLFGEKIVLRILDKKALAADIGSLGIEGNSLERLKKNIVLPQGLILVTGPTGSGKTTTLYSILNILNREETNIMTVEDPIEFHFKGINQVNVNPEIGMTFANALRAFLRQDPDVIMVGEIRDYETAEIAMKAALTGHLVFSTVHTNDTASTISRMIDLGVPPFMMASSISMILAQRLGRRLCNHCKAPQGDLGLQKLFSYGFSEDDIPGLKLYRAAGCHHCNGVGYRGRVGFFEVMEISNDLSKAISSKLPEEQIRKLAIRNGMQTLRMAALEKAKEGVTSLDEVLHRTVITEESLPSYLVNPDTEEYQHGEFLIREGNNDKDFFKLVRGKLLVFKEGKKIAEIAEQGEYFGEMAALLGCCRSTSIVSEGRTIVDRYPGDKLLDLIETKPEVAKRLFVNLTKRLQQANNALIKLMGARANDGASFSEHLIKKGVSPVHPQLTGLRSTVEPTAVSPHFVGASHPIEAVNKPY